MIRDGEVHRECTQVDVSRTRQGDYCVTSLPKRKREGKSGVTEVEINRTSVATPGG